MRMKTVVSKGRKNASVFFRAISCSAISEMRNVMPSLRLIGHLIKEPPRSTPHRVGSSKSGLDSKVTNCKMQLLPERQRLIEWQKFKTSRGNVSADQTLRRKQTNQAADQIQDASVGNSKTFNTAKTFLDPSVPPRFPTL
jgi:hypothetical protein